jgi:hypothetical protein
MTSKRTERWLKGEQSFLDKVTETVFNIGFGILIITIEAVKYVSIIGFVVGFWYGVYYIIKTLLS